MFLKTFLWTLNIFLLLQLSATKSLDKTKSNASEESTTAATATTVTLNGVPVKDLTRRQQFLYNVKDNLYNLLYANTLKFKYILQNVLADPFLQTLNSTDIMNYRKIMKSVVDEIEAKERSMKNVTLKNVCFYSDTKSAGHAGMYSLVNVYKEVASGNITFEKLLLLQYLNIHNFPYALNKHNEEYNELIKNFNEDLRNYILKSALWENRGNRDLIEWHEEYEKNDMNDAAIKTAVFNKLAGIINFI